MGEGEHMSKRMVEPWELAADINARITPGILLNTKVADKFNTMVIGWGHIGVIWNEPYFVAYVRSSRFTYEQLLANPQFSVSLPAEGHLPPEVIKVAGRQSGRDLDKVAELGLDLVEPEVISVPGIAQFPLTLECEVTYHQEQDFAALDPAVHDRYYHDNDGVTTTAASALHTAFFGHILSSYVIE